LLQNRYLQKVLLVIDIDFVFALLNYNNCKLLLDCVYIPLNTHNYIYTAYFELVERIIPLIIVFEIISDFNEPSSNNILNVAANSFINYLDLKQCNDVKNHRHDILF